MERTARMRPSRILNFAHSLICAGLFAAASGAEPLSGAGGIEFTSSNLPIVVITTPEGSSIPDEPKITAHMGIIFNGPGTRNALNDPFNEYDGSIGIERRGNVTQTFAKKPYAIETRDEAGGNLNVSLLGLPNENDWILRAAYIDKTFIRDPLGMHMSRCLGRWASRTIHCELVLNGEYLGIYILMEKIKPDRNRVNIERMSPADLEGDAVTGGYIYEVAQSGPDFGLRRRFKYPKGDKIMPQQAEYIRAYDDGFRTAMAGPHCADPLMGYPAWIDSDSFIDEILVQEACKNSDAYGWSSYFHKDRLGRLGAGPVWDFDQALSNSTFNDGPRTWEWLIEKSEHDSWLRQNYPPFWIRLFREADFKQRLVDRWRQVRAGPWTDSALLAFIDSTAALLQEAQARNFAKWPILGCSIWRSTPGAEERRSFALEVEYLKAFLVDRLEWMDRQLSPASAVMIGTGEGVPRPESGLVLYNNYPNPFNAETTFRFHIDRAGRVRLGVYNLLGEEVDTVLDQFLPAGGHSVRWHAGSLPGGVYGCRIECGSRRQSGKMTLLR